MGEPAEDDVAIVEDGIFLWSGRGFLVADPQYRMYHGPFDTIEKARERRQMIENMDGWIPSATKYNPDYMVFA